MGGVGGPGDRDAMDGEVIELVRRCQAGDKAAIAELYVYYGDTIYGYLVKMLGDERDARDAVQTVFVNVMRSIERFEFRPGSPFEAWLFEIARNAGRDIQRAGWRRHERPEAPEVIDGMREGPSEEGASSLGWLRSADLEMLVRQLPEAQRAVIVLHHLEDLKMKQIAELLGRSPGAVRKLHQRALTALQERLVAIRERRERRAHRTPMRMRVKPARVMASRRFALEKQRAPTSFYSPTEAYRRPF